MALGMEEDPAAVAVVGGRGKHLETPTRDSSGLEVGTTVDAEGRSDRQVGRIRSCSDCSETTIAETVEIVEETLLEEVAEEVAEEVVVVTIMEDPVASAHLRLFTTMDRPMETVEGMTKVLI